VSPQELTALIKLFPEWWDLITLWPARSEPSTYPSDHIAWYTLGILVIAFTFSYVARTILTLLGILLHVTLLYRAQSHLPNKKSLSSRAKPDDSQSESSGAVEGPAFACSAIVADALNLPFPDNTFDLVSCSLFAHHLSPEQVTKFARESLRVCRQAVLINDLIRHPLHLALVYGGLPLYRSRLTRHDAPASVRQAHTVEEMQRFVQQAGAARVEIQRHYLYRMGVIAWKKKAVA
jgi:hypothetical protein